MPNIDERIASMRERMKQFRMLIEQRTAKAQAAKAAEA
jgi:hypothetical protein